MNFWNPIKFGNGCFVWSYLLIGMFIDFLVVFKILEFFVNGVYCCRARVKVKLKIIAGVIEKSFICIINLYNLIYA